MWFSNGDIHKKYEFNTKARGYSRYSGVVKFCGLYCGSVEQLGFQLVRIDFSIACEQEAVDAVPLKSGVRFFLNDSTSSIDLRMF